MTHFMKLNPLKKHLLEYELSGTRETAENRLELSGTRETAENRLVFFFFFSGTMRKDYNTKRGTQLKKCFLMTTETRHRTQEAKEINVLDSNSGEIAKRRQRSSFQHDKQRDEKKEREANAEESMVGA
ncbi:hypothetical protein V6N13_044578 [Hibiscus sabdariffa]